MVCLLFAVFSGCKAGQAKNQVCLEGKCFDVELAQTSKERMRGLQHREFLHESSGMLFIFKESGRHSFWMKNTLIPLDIIWLDHAKRIVHIEHNVPPCKIDNCPSYTSDKNASYVLEINAGKAKELGMLEDMQFNFHLNSLLAR